MQIDDLIGVPFKYGARPNDGSGSLDCYGVVVEVGKRQGLTYPQRQFAENLAIVHTLMDLQMDEWQPCKQEAGAVILFRIRGMACHVGVMLDEDRFIHTWKQSGGVVIERLSDGWQKRVVDFYAYAGKQQSNSPLCDQ